MTRLNAATIFVDRHLAEGRGARVAHRAQGRPLTWAEVAAAADRWGNALGELGVGRGDRVMLVLDDSPAFVNEQGVPHPPQSVSVEMLVSQPSPALPLQFRKATTHTGAQAYVPGMPVQLVVPWSLVQALPQLEQFVTVPSVVSQPAAAEHSANPAWLPVGVLVTVALDAAAFGTEHGSPQRPQWVLVVTLVSQPSSGFELQFRKPSSQVGEQS